MEIKDFIGYKLDETLPYLIENNIDYRLIETWDTKKTKMGDEVRIVNIKVLEVVQIYIAYF